MRIVLVLAVAGTVILTSCAGKNATAPQAPAGPAPLASWTGGSIDQSRWDNYLKNAGVPPTADAKDREKAFNEFLRTNLEAQAARDGGVSADSSKAKRWASIVQRIEADFLRREFVGGQDGFSDSAIQKWAASQDSATRKLPLDTLRRRGGEALLLHGVKLDSVYKANLDQFRKEVPTTLPFDSVKARVRDLALAGAKNAADSAARTTAAKLDSVYKADAAQFRKDSSVQLSFDSAKVRVREYALRIAQEKLMRDYLPGRREAYKVKTLAVTRPAIPDDTLKAYWKRTSERWSSTAVYHLSALGSKDSAKLAKALSGAKDLAAFRKLSATFPVGSPVRAPNGVLGRVKQQYSLPYGLGMVPALFSQLDTAKAGLVHGLVKAGDTLFLAVWLEGRDSSTVRPFAEVKGEVQTLWEQANPYVAPDSTTMATWDKGVLFRKSDVAFISEEVPPQMRRQYPPERVLDFMITWAVSHRAAVESGYANRPSLQTAILENSQMYWAQEFRGGVDRQQCMFPRKALDSALAVFLKGMPKSYQPDTAAANRDGARAILIHPGEMAESYADGIDNYRQDTVFQAFDSVKVPVFGRMRSSIEDRCQLRVDSVLKARYQVKVSDAAPKAPAKLPAKIALDSARAKHDRRVLDEAEALYRQVETDAGAPDSLRSQALFQMGQMFGESQSYLKSLEAYRAVLRRFPKSNEAYKAQFMIAFTYSEYLKVEKVAVAEYRKVLANYPKCDLANDADWMIRNILSGGALMPKFDDSAFVADSIARADSLKKVSAKKDAGTPKADAKSAPKVEAAKPAAAKADGSKPAAAKTDSVKATKPVAAKAKSDTAKAAGKK
jgi:hypothetical protein